MPEYKKSKTYFTGGTEYVYKNIKGVETHAYFNYDPTEHVFPTRLVLLSIAYVLIICALICIKLQIDYGIDLLIHIVSLCIFAGVCIITDLSIPHREYHKTAIQINSVPVKKQYRCTKCKCVFTDNKTCPSCNADWPYIEMITSTDSSCD